MLLLRMLLWAVLIGGLDILQYKAAIMYMGEVKSQEDSRGLDKGPVMPKRWKKSTVFVKKKTMSQSYTSNRRIVLILMMR
jgi:hypothetical protein